MKLYKDGINYKLYQGSMLDICEYIFPNSVDCIVTDPPYELSFMNKGWDNTGISLKTDTWKKCFDVLKFGGYLVAFGGSRTYHRLACAIEDAGFEIRDCIMWLYGSGFPKSMNIEKAINKKAKRNHILNETDEVKKLMQCSKQWQGWGTCLKPAYEPIIIARKPFKGSVVDNILKYNVGALNIDECRVENKNGRFPSNVILTYNQLDFNEVCGAMPYTKQNGSIKKIYDTNNRIYGKRQQIEKFTAYNDEGSVCRYFYCAKTSKRDREEGMDEFLEKTINDGRKKSIDNPFQRGKTSRRNIHPTVKPTELMQYLIRLIAPKGSTILDPFMGSGSTGKAAMYENKERNSNYKFIGIELIDEYLPIAEARINYVVHYEK